MMRPVLWFLPIALTACASAPKETVSKVALPPGLHPASLPKADVPHPAMPLPMPPLRINATPTTKIPVDAEMNAESAEKEGISVEGACRYADGDVACWDMAGAPSKALTQAVRIRLQVGAPELPFRIGYKSRLVSVLLPPFSATDSMSTVGGPPSAGPTTTVEATTGEAGPRHVMVVCSTDLHGKVGSIVFERTTRLPALTKIALKVGARATLAGMQIGVTSVEKLDAHNDPRTFLMGSDAWEIHVDPLKGALPSMSLFPVDPFPNQLANGNRVADADLKKGRLRSLNAFHLQSSYSSDQKTGSTTVTVDRDPKKIGSLQVGANRRRRVRVTGIPMDPADAGSMGPAEPATR